ncbi:hypothetical protein IWQ61_004667 [Dispira simplex]|nr:hypothetical protein IWQ61_004667 [Dispira simplex]
MRNSPTHFAVKQGHRPGVYCCRTALNKQIKDFRDAVYQHFPTYQEAFNFAFSYSGEVRHEGSRYDLAEEEYNSEEDIGEKLGHIYFLRTYVSEAEADAYEALHFESEENGSYFKAIDRPPKLSPNATVVEPQHQDVYTNGATSDDGGPNVKTGIGVYFGPKDSRNACAVLSTGPQTNQRAELMAIKLALMHANLELALVVHSDSEYAIKCFTIWRYRWELPDGSLRRWITSEGSQIVHVDLIMEIIELLEFRPYQTKFKPVPTNSSIEGHERAMALAHKAIQH